MKNLRQKLRLTLGLGLTGLSFGEPKKEEKRGETFPEYRPSGEKYIYRAGAGVDDVIRKTPGYNPEIDFQ